MSSLSKIIGVAVILAADVFMIAMGSIRSSLIVMQLMMIVTVMIVSFSRSKLKIDKRDLDAGKGKDL